MKITSYIIFLFSSIFFSSYSFGDWKLISTSSKGNEFYVDVSTIKRHGTSIFVWRLNNYLKPNSGGYLSDVSYIECDCETFREKDLQIIFHKKHFGKGESLSIDFSKVSKKYSEWRYPSPNSVNRIVLDYTCNN
tara:strand:- start:470 stop:871 length:402 start_codon:yes stop_codon:yes gene_type:complete